VPASAEILRPGQHTSTITVTACTSGPDCASGLIGAPQTIAVTYTVNGLWLFGCGQLDYSVRTSTPDLEYGRGLTFKAYPSYTISSTVPWLTVTRGGTSSAGVPYDVRLTRPMVDNMDSSRYSGAVNIDVPGFPTKVIPVSLVINYPQLDQVTPYVALANRAGTVTLRGGIDEEQVPAAGIDLLPLQGGSAITPTAVTPVHGSEKRLSHPPLPPGTYQVRIRNAQGVIIDRSKAHLFVYDTPAFPAATLQYPAAAQTQVRQLLFDPERNALWVMVDHPASGVSASQILRYTWSGGAWSGPAVMRTGPVSGMGLSANGQTMYVSSRAETLNGSYAVNDLMLTDPATLQARSTLHPATSGTDFQSFAFDSLGQMYTMETSRELTGAWPAYILVIRGGEFAPLSFGPGSPPSFARGFVAGSANGSRVLFGGESGNFHLVDGSQNGSSPLPPPSLQSLRLTDAMLDRDGERALLHTFDGDLPIYSRSWQLLGALPTKRFGGLGPASAATFSAVIAPNGTEAYTYTWAGTLRRFDLAQATAGGEFQSDGSAVPMSADPGLNNGLNNVLMAITPDSKTLFIAGGTQIVVVPLP
jgi:hypothetical protein